MPWSNLIDKILRLIAIGNLLFAWLLVFLRIPWIGGVVLSILSVIVLIALNSGAVTMKFSRYEKDGHPVMYYLGCFLLTAGNLYYTYQLAKT